MLLQLFVTLVALLPCSLVRFFFAAISILGRFWLNQVVRDFWDFLSLFLSFFLVHPYGLGGGISLSAVNPLDYVKKIGKFKMEIPPKNLTRQQDNKDDALMD